MKHSILTTGSQFISGFISRTSVFAIILLLLVLVTQCLQHFTCINSFSVSTQITCLFACSILILYINLHISQWNLIYTFLVTAMYTYLPMTHHLLTDVIDGNKKGCFTFICLVVINILTSSTFIRVLRSVLFYQFKSANKTHWINNC